MGTRQEKPPEQGERLGSAELASLIVDALLRAQVLRQQDVEFALRIVGEEIEVRKAMGDY